MTIAVQPNVEEEKIGSLKKAITRLQEDLNTQKIISETVSEENRELKSQIKKMKNIQSGLDKRVKKIETLFQGTWKEVTAESAKTILDVATKTNKKSREERS